MKTNFDKLIPRAGTNSSKWETIQSEEESHLHVRTERFMSGEAIPMWISDMDFAAPPPVVEALTARAKHGLYGYTEESETYGRAVANWMKTRHALDIQPDWITIAPGVVPGMSMMLRAVLKPGDKAILQSPVYYPFFLMLEFNNFKIVDNPLRYEDGRYHMDFDDLEVVELQHKKERIIDRRLQNGLVARFKDGAQQHCHAGYHARRDGDPIRLNVQVVTRLHPVRDGAPVGFGFFGVPV